MPLDEAVSQLSTDSHWISLRYFWSCLEEQHQPFCRHSTTAVLGEDMVYRVSPALATTPLLSMIALVSFLMAVEMAFVSRHVNSA
jgi:hypothetical protein